MIIAKEPSLNFLAQFMTPTLFTSKGYHIDAPNIEVKLDQNESPWDWPEEVKNTVLTRLKSMPWNRYPSPFADEVAEKLAKKLDVDSRNILLGPGSNYLIALVLQTFSKAIIGKVVLARPSFALYEAQCNYEGIKFEPWLLNDDLEYDPNLLPSLPKGSLVVFASPNNPVGNVLSRKVLAGLLEAHPDTLFVGDEAYCEFADEPYTDLLSKYSNLLLIRTFSKTMGAAGVRLGYILGAANVIELLRKPRVPFLINQFTIAAVTEVLENSAMGSVFDGIVQNAMSERKRVFVALQKEEARLKYKVKSSQANFLLVRWPTTDFAMVAYKHLMNTGILVRNVSSAPGLSGCLRISIGTEVQNNRLIEAFLSLRQV